MGKAHGEMRKRRDAAQNLGDVASTPAEHRAAAVAHRHAARIQFDSELRAGHEQAAAGHAKQGQEAAAPAENPAKRKAIDATSRAQVATDKADRENTPEAHDKAAQAHGEARQAHFDAQPSEFNHPDAEIHRIARRGHGDNEERHEAAARRLRAGTKPTEPTRNAPHGYTEANIRSHDALESAELAEDNTPEGRKAHQLSDDAHSLTAWKRSHTDAADAHGKAAKAHRDLHASTPNRYHKEAAEHHEAMVGYHKQADPARNTAPERPMQKAIIEARILNLDIQADRVGGDPIALAALEMRRKALANNDKK